LQGDGRFTPEPGRDLEFFFVTLAPSLQLKAVPFPAAQFLGQDPVGVFFSSFLLFLSPVTSKPASRGRIKTGHSEALHSYQVS
jgi:hypothetical protein